MPDVKSIEQHCRDLLDAAHESNDLTGMASLLQSLLAANRTVDIEKLRDVLSKPCPPVYAYDFESYDKAWRFLLANREEVQSLLAEASENGRMMAVATPSGRTSCYPPVLDACCGPRMMWINKHDARAIYFDRRDEDCEIKPNAAYPNGGTLRIRPDVQGDFANMPFPDETFRLVVFDPPHFTSIGLTGVLGMTYGKLFPDWEDGLRAGFSECFRVLKPEGVLIFKWCSTQIPLKRVLALAPCEPLFGHNTGNKAQTHWMTFMKPAVGG